MEITFEQGKDFQQAVFAVGNTELDDYSVKELMVYLKAADELYTNEGDSFLEDFEYDALKQYLEAANPGDPYFTKVGSEVRGGKVVLPFQMGSLNQVFIGGWDSWVTSNDLDDETLVISDKEDGGSDMIRYTRGKLSIAYSRGDGLMGADITRHISKIPSVPKDLSGQGIDLTVRCEHIISPANFKKLQEMGIRSRSGKPYKNPRNMVAGLMNAETNDPRVYQYIDVIAYEIVGGHQEKIVQLEFLEDLGFKVVPYGTFKGRNLSEQKLTDWLVKRRKESAYEIDGVVAEANSIAARKRLHVSGDLNPGYAVKFKVADESNQAVATVKKVEWRLSKDGYYKPRVHIEPVELAGVTIRHFTGFNAKFIKENGIGPGAKIRVTRSGDVIPFIQECVQPVKPQMPDDEDAVWTPTGVDLVVSGDNDTVKFKQLEDFFNSIDIPNLAGGNIKTMFDAGFETPESIITLSQQDVSQVIGSRSIGKKIWEGMRAKFTNIPMWKLMGAHPAFGRGVGERKMKKLYDAWHGDMSHAASVTRICHVEGFDTKTAHKIVDGFDEFQEFLQAVEGYVTISRYERPKQGKLTGQDIVVTGFRDKQLEALVEQHGGRVASSVSSKTYVVVAAEPSGSSTKLEKARSLGIKIVSREEFVKML